ncbi:MAG: hypothetical protein IIA58_04175 [Candidatus Marinimicrobia bacterium]|nr:hypothetical protein [Candidatus Neomarinimicrobiota bacterium]
MKFNHSITLLLFLGTFSQSFAGEGFLVKREVALSSGESLSLVYLNTTIQDSVGKRVFAKRPGLSFMSSAVLPGAGQYYNGSLKKALGFLVAEIGLWWGYTTLQGNANDKVDEYKTFADEYWSFDAWIASGDTAGDGGGHKIARNPNTGDPVKNNEYYENIGKYDQFNRGWAGAFSLKELTEERSEYIKMQDDANNLFSLATTVASTVMLNHIISAAEAVYTAKKLNDKASMTISLKAIPVKTQDRIIGRLSLTLVW